MKTKTIWLITAATTSTLAVILIATFVIKTPMKPPQDTPAPAEADLPERLYSHVDFLTKIRPFRHNENSGSLNKAAAYIKKYFQEFGLQIQTQEFIVEGQTYQNILASYGDPSLPRVVIGAHYDVCGDQPGADDNASAVAGLIELARMVSQKKPELDYHIEFAAYSLEEPPHFYTENMGSYVHAKSLRDQNAEVKLMIALEMIGYFSEEKDSQEYPSPLLKAIYPGRGDFIAIVGRMSDKKLIDKTKKAMVQNSKIPVEALAAPETLTGVDFSDHLNFWLHGYHALMITDTAFYRNPNYHEITDTIETLNFDKMTEVVRGVYGAIIGFSF